MLLPHAVNGSELQKVLFLALSVTFLFVCEISLEPLNEFASNSQGSRVWFLARKTLNVKVKGQRSQGQNGIFWPFQPLVLFMYEISREPLNGFAPYSHGRHVWSLARTSLKVKVKGQRSRSPGT